MHRTPALHLAVSPAPRRPDYLRKEELPRLRFDRIYKGPNGKRTMNLIENDWKVSSLAFSDDTRERYAGLHVSAISRSLCTARGIVKNPNNMTPEQVDEYAAVGFLEERMSKALMESLVDAPYVATPPVVAVAPDGRDARLLDPGEIVPAGWIIGTPDWLELDDELILTDCKATYKSRGIDTASTWVRKNRWDWELNTKFYAFGLRLAGVDVARVRFRVLFMAGDYRPVRPMRRIWTTPELSINELRDNFDMLVQHAREERMFTTP